MKISKDILVDMYSKMLLMRRFEEKLIELYREGMKGSYHLTLGQEAVAAGACAVLNKDDYIFSTHRAKGHYIAKGGDLKAMMAEFLEKQTGCNKGKGGPMHIIDPSVGMLGANGIVGANLSIACGAALSAKLRASGQVDRVESEFFSKLSPGQGAKEFVVKRKRFSVEQIVVVLKPAELGMPVTYLIWRVGISEQTFYRWKK